VRKLSKETEDLGEVDYASWFGSCTFASSRDYSVLMEHQNDLWAASGFERGYAEVYPQPTALAPPFEM
jgi:hypothetical protein